MLESGVRLHVPVKVELVRNQPLSYTEPFVAPTFSTFQNNYM